MIKVKLGFVTNSSSTNHIIMWNGDKSDLRGILEAHSGLAVSPETLLADERLVKVQTGEGILPREAMVQLGEENFEALRSGRFQVNQGGGSPRYDITIQVQSLDAAGVAGLDWERVVQRHLLPALERELTRRF